VLDRGQLRQDPRQQRDQRRVDDDHLVFGVPDDEHELLGEQPDVQRVQDGAHARHREVRDQVLRVVPHERADPLVAGDPEVVVEGVGQPGACRPISAKLERRGAESPPVQVTTSAPPWTVLPCSNSRDTCSGIVIIVLAYADRSGAAHATEG
jgi:hypothetical protein